MQTAYLLGSLIFSAFIFVSVANAAKTVEIEGLNDPVASEKIKKEILGALKNENQDLLKWLLKKYRLKLGTGSTDERLVLKRYDENDALYVAVSKNDYELESLDVDR